MLQRTEAGGVVYYCSPLLSIAGVRHGFSTRLGGVSPAPFDSLNLGNPSGCSIQDDDPRIQENYRRFQLAIGCVGQRCWSHQVHGTDVATVPTAKDFRFGRPADALVTTDPDAVLAIRIADCVPILISSRTGTAVAAIHAGWRGVVGGVVPAAVRRLKEMAPATSLFAAIGPCISYNAFEVGPEVVTAFREKFGAAAPVKSVGDKGRVDLQEAVRLQLIQEGLDSDSIDGNDRCTYRDRDEFFSHRRDNGITGRLAALIQPRNRS